MTFRAEMNIFKYLF